MDKASQLFEAYKSRKEIDPFPLTEEEARSVGEEFSKMLVDQEGLGGYKIAKSGIIGILTKPMITFNDIELWFKTHKLEVEIIALVKNGKIQRTYIGLELPATRFNKWDLPDYYVIADDAFAGRLYVGKEIEPPYGSFKLFINDKFISAGAPSYDPNERVKDFMNGYVALGAFIGPVKISKGDKVRVEGKKTISVKII
ncbi:2-keto-4-pentenoate hydratase [Acidianus sulfidivorans JP7]|uniref:2-keto-4-pentenoate hydratase n=1 Tax=Acidianus sulfidivorans JP7 TaxID=619593 RepID=A0A2U9IQF2_9CREN|nr:2-keto-4-pentenoate hydratase [Acidianus sulfidivorans]AWR98187.1 2-keto-4-pentenoate hydratase [Acidianus sulfidivorans JP7]